MKKIGVLTFHRPINYGAFLQSFSLSSRLAKEFPDSKVEIIDYISVRENKKIYLNALRELKFRGTVSMINEIKKIRTFQQSLKALPLSPKKICSDDVDALYRYINDNYNYLVIGSDAVLNWKQNGYPSAYYPPESCKIPTLGFAVSAHGLYYNELSDDEREYCRSAFDKFEFIGYRDENTSRFIENTGSATDKAHVCDPTFFIDLDLVHQRANGWQNRVLEKYHFDAGKKYIALMINDNTISETVYKKYHNEYTIVTLFKNNKWADVFLYDLNPFEWVEVLGCAEVVFTQYFHGALLTLRTGKVPIVIDMAKKTNDYESKLHDVIVSRMMLDDIYFHFDDALKHSGNVLDAADRVIGGEYREFASERFKIEQENIYPFIERLSGLIDE